MVMPMDEVRARVAAREHDSARRRVENQRATYSYARPLLSAAVDLIDWMANEDHRLMFGLSEIDACLRGIGGGELCYVTGRAHSGKTQLVLHMVCENPGRRLMYFTPDEVDNLVLTKLIARVHGINAAELEALIKSRDRNAIQLVRRTAEQHFGKLMINDQALTFNQMTTGLREAEQQWGDKCEGVIVDYLDLLPGDADFNGTKTKSVHLKRWAKEHGVPVVCIHQPKRGGANRGRRIGMDDMNQGGETEATFVLGVFRKRDDYELPIYDRQTHTNTLTVCVDKNKRPPCHVGEFDYFLDPHSGQIRHVRPDDGVEPGMPMTAAVARAVRERPPAEPTGHAIQRALTGVA